MAMTPPAKIRVANPDDSVAYERFMATLFTENLSTLCPRAFTPSDAQVHVWLSTHTAESSVVFLAESGSELVGTVNLTRFARPHLDHSVGLGLNVRADLRGQGIGKALLQHAISWFLRVPSIERIELEVMANNPAAVHLYKAFGFTQEGRKVGAVKKGADYIDLVTMALRKNENHRPSSCPAPTGQSEQI